MSQYILHPAVAGAAQGNQFAMEQMKTVAQAQDLAARNLMNEQAKRNATMMQIQRERDLIDIDINPITGQPMTSDQRAKFPSSPGWGKNIVESLAQAYVRDQNRIMGKDPNTPESIANPRQTMSNVMPGAMMPLMPYNWNKEYSRAQLDQQGRPILQMDPQTGRPMIDPQTGKTIPVTTPYYTPEFFNQPIQYQNQNQQGRR